MSSHESKGMSHYKDSVLQVQEFPSQQYYNHNGNPFICSAGLYISTGLWLSSMIWNWCYLNKSWVPPICPVVPMYMISLWHVISLWCVGRHDPSRIDFTGSDQYCWLHATPSKQMVINKQWLSSYGILEHPYVFFCTFWGFIQYISRIMHMIHAYCWSPGCQMRPINHPGDPECRPGWSGGRIANLPVIQCL